MKVQLALTAIVFTLSIHTPAAAEGKNPPAAASTKKDKDMTATVAAANTVATKSAADVVKGFFEAFGKGDADGVVNAFHKDAVIVAVRKGERKGTQLHGSYAGQQGAKDFVTNLGKNFDTKAFSVDQVIGEGNVAFASGAFVHNIRSTGKPYASDWALKVIVKDGKILEYHFYEDSAGFVEASKN
jgi:ketosteroid isomerase-like protein